MTWELQVYQDPLGIQWETLPPRSCICDSDQAFITLLTNSQEHLGTQEMSYNGSITRAGKRKISYYLQDWFSFTLFTLEIAWCGALGQSGSSQCSGLWMKPCHNVFLKGAFWEVGSFVGVAGGGGVIFPHSWTSNAERCPTLGLELDGNYLVLRKACELGTMAIASPPYKSRRWGTERWSTFPKVVQLVRN